MPSSASQQAACACRRDRRDSGFLPRLPPVRVAADKRRREGSASVVPSSGVAMSPRVEGLPLDIRALITCRMSDDVRRSRRHVHARKTASSGRSRPMCPTSAATVGDDASRDRVGLSTPPTRASISSRCPPRDRDARPPPASRARPQEQPRSPARSLGRGCGSIARRQRSASRKD